MTILFLAPAAIAPATGERDLRITASRPAAGERCVICEKALGPADRVYRVRGRWVPVHAGVCERELLREKTAFAAYQPRGALFQEDLAPRDPVRWRWALLGLYAVLGFVGAAWCAHLAYPRARSPVRWFFLGFALNLLAVAVLLISSRPVRRVPKGLRRLPGTSDPVACGACGATNHPSAPLCAGCGVKLMPTVLPEVRRAS